MKAGFICLEGAEAVGKSTQIKLLEKAFIINSIDYIKTHEPGGCENSEHIRNLIFSKNFDPMTDLLLFFASRHENILKNIIPSLQNNKFILCDRFILSSIIYQGILKGIDIDLILDLHQKVNFGIYPDITIILNVQVSTIKSRLSARKAKNKIDNESIEFHEKVASAFTNYDKVYQHNTYIVDADLSIYEVHKNIISIINNSFNTNLKPIKFNNKESYRNVKPFTK